MPGREANLAFRSERISSADLVKGLAEKDIAAKNGHFYAYRLLKAMGVPDLNDGVLRLSLSHYNTEEEVGRCVEALKGMLSA
jgi:selenocysteine lyase/cysteine desulfurase